MTPADELIAEIHMLRQLCDSLSADADSGELTKNQLGAEAIKIMTEISSLHPQFETVLGDNPPDSCKEDLIAIASFLQDRVGVKTAPTSDEVCPACNKPQDEHLVRELRECLGAFSVPRTFAAGEEPTFVVLGEQPEIATGVVVMAVANQNKEGKLRASLIFRFVKPDGSFYTDRMYTADPSEMQNLAGIIRDGVAAALKAIKEYNG